MTGSSQRRCYVIKGVLRNFTKFTEKHLCNFIKKETLVQVLFCEFCKISGNTFSTEHLCTRVLLTLWCSLSVKKVNGSKLLILTNAVKP